MSLSQRFPWVARDVPKEQGKGAGESTAVGRSAFANAFVHHLLARIPQVVNPWKKINPDPAVTVEGSMSTACWML